jgi:LEA14-like dessication related protein
MKRRASILLLACLAASANGCSKPKPVAITPQSAQLGSIGPDGVGLSLVLNVHNPNSFPIMASAVNAVVELQDGQELGRGSSLPAFTIPSQGDASLPAQVDLRWTNLALVTPFALAAKPLPYRVRGSARIGGESLNVELPFTIDGQLTPEQVVQAGLRGATSLLPKH